MKRYGMFSDHPGVRILRDVKYTSVGNACVYVNSKVRSGGDRVIIRGITDEPRK